MLKTERQTADTRKNPIYLIQHLGPVLDDTLSFELLVDEAWKKTPPADAFLSTLTHFLHFHEDMLLKMSWPFPPSAGSGCLPLKAETDYMVSQKCAAKLT